MRKVIFFIIILIIINLCRRARFSIFSGKLSRRLLLWMSKASCIAIWSQKTYCLSKKWPVLLLKSLILDARETCQVKWFLKLITILWQLELLSMHLLNYYKIFHIPANVMSGQEAVFFTYSISEFILSKILQFKKHY